MAEARLLSDAVVEYTDVLRDFVFGLFPGRKTAVMHRLRLQ